MSRPNTQFAIPLSDREESPALQPDTEGAGSEAVEQIPAPPPPPIPPAIELEMRALHEAIFRALRNEQELVAAAMQGRFVASSEHAGFLENALAEARAKAAHLRSTIETLRHPPRRRATTGGNNAQD